MASDPTGTCKTRWEIERAQKKGKNNGCDSGQERRGVSNESCIEAFERTRQKMKEL